MDPRLSRYQWNAWDEPAPWPVRHRLDRLTLVTRIGWTLFTLLLLGAFYRAAIETL